MNTNNHSTIFSFTVAACLLASCSNTLNDPVANTVTFSDVSETVGLKTQDNWKYGGPSVSDLNNDGYYDLLLTNHDTTPVQLFMAKGKDKYLEQREVFSKVDLHGIAAGDYDLDGDNDILLSVGGVMDCILVLKECCAMTRVRLLTLLKQLVCQS